MSLYDYVTFVVYKIFGTFSINNSQGAQILPLYPTRFVNYENGWAEESIQVRGGYLWSAWQRVLTNPELSWWNRIASDPKLLISTIIWVVCVWITIELCLILPFRWFKRLLRYPNHKLMTPQEVKRSKLK